ncbi:MAG: VTT domain-containing protein [Acidobacteria bacterium]|nr:VTT domain-containing protein [Acidobacteriota bacterium]
MDLGLGHLSGWWPYWGILIAAIVEGEIAYIGAAALVAQGHLSPFGVVLAGSFGAAIGDQAFFYVFRGRLPRWMAKYPSLEKKTAPLLERVRTHDALMVLLIRFAPGLRVAIAAACAWVDVSPLKFSVLNLLSSFVWAIGLLILVGWFGPAYLAHYGLGGWKGAVLVGLIILGLFKLLGRYEERTLEERQSSEF